MVPPVEYADFKEKAFVKKKLAEQKLKGVALINRLFRDVTAAYMSVECC